MILIIVIIIIVIDIVWTMPSQIHHEDIDRSQFKARRRSVYLINV